jgi:alanyl-tRNA synthetase
LKKTELLENKLNELISLLKSDHDETVNKELVKKVVEFTDDVSHATIPYWKKVCYCCSR